MRKPRAWERIASSDNGILILFGLGVVLLHCAVNGRYGFHRDELLTFDNARDLAWGYVVYPPVTAFLARVELELFGASLIGFRFFAALSQGIVLVFTGLIARELGGKREAQILAASAVAISGHSLFSGGFFSYTTLDYAWWTVAGFFVARFLRTGDGRWRIAIGAALGLGMMTKYTSVFLVLGVLGGTLLTPARRSFANLWFWLGVATATLIVLPNLLWQMQNDFVSLAFVQSIHARDIGRGWTDNFLLNQLWKCANPVTVPLWGAGLWFLLATPAGRRFRLLGWMYVLPLVALFAARGRDYYLASAYPMLLAAGSVWGERWVGRLSPSAARGARRTVWQTLATAGLITAALTLPIAPIGTTWWRIADTTNGNFNMEVGWPELATTVAQIRTSLPAADQAKLGILAGDEGEAGAINLYGPALGLPRAISGMNSNWMRGYGDPPPETLITLGLKRDVLDGIFASCELAGRAEIPFGIENTAIKGFEDVFVCRRVRLPWPEFWRRFRYYG
jgi:4-amino-4-deoxy-L-arabinose transferase-like glycosyltransferase